MKFTIKNTFIFIFVASALITLFGCNGKDRQPHEDEVVTAQKLYDEADKGPGKTDLRRLKKMYDKFVVDKESADSVAAIGADGTKNHFLCLALLLPTVSETKGIVEHFTGKLTDSKKVINTKCANAKAPFDLLLDPTRNVADDKADEADEIITILVDKGDDDTVKVASDNAKLTKVLNAFKSKGQPAGMTKVFSATTLKNDALAWFIVNAADVKVKPALRAAAFVTDEMIVNEAAKGATTDIPKLKFLVETKVIDQVTAASLSNQAATAGGAAVDRFSNYLSRLPATADTAAVWADFFTQLGTAPGVAADVTAQINRAGAGGVGDTPFAAMVDDVRAVVGDVLAERQGILTLMVKQGDQATVQAANSKAKMDLMLDAILAKDSAELMNAFNEIDLGARGADLVAWSVPKAATPAVVTAARSVIAYDMIVNEAAKGATTDIPTLKFLYETKVEGQQEAVSLSNQAATAGGAVADRFSNYLSRLPATLDTAAIWADFFTKLRAAPGVAADVVAEINRAGAGGPGDTPFAVMVDDGRAVVGDVLAQRQGILTLMVKQGDQTTVRAANSKAKMDLMLDAVLVTDSAALAGAFGQVDLLARGADLIDWSRANAGTAGVVAAARPLITDAMIVDEAAQGAGADIPRLKFLYETKVVDQLAAASLSNQAATAGGAVADRFSNYLSRLPATLDTAAIWADFFTKLRAAPGVAADVVAEINRAGAGGPGDTPFAAMVDDARAVVGDVLAERQGILTLMVKQGDQATVRAANSKAKMDLMLDAVLAGDAAELSTVFGKIDLGARGADLVAWSVPKANMPAVVAAARPLITDAMIVDEAAKGVGVGGTDIPTLKFLYETKVIDQATAASLSNQAATAGGAVADRFSNYLSRLPATLDTAAIWADFFTMLEAAPGGTAADVVAQINFAGAGVTPFAAMVDDVRVIAGDVPGKRQEILTSMVEKGDRATVRQANSKAKMDLMLDAILAKGTRATMLNAFNDIELGARRADLLAWVKANADSDGARPLGAKVGEIFAEVRIRITQAVLVAEAQITRGADMNDIMYLYGLYKRHIDGAGGQVVAAAAQQNIAAVALENWNTGGNYTTGHAGDGFLHLVARLPAIQATHDILADLIAKATAGGTLAATIKGRVDVGPNTILQILDGTAGPRPAGDDATQLAAMTALAM